MAINLSIVSLHNSHLPKTAGNKAHNLKKLYKAGFLIPRTYIYTWKAYERYLNNDTNLENELIRELQQIIVSGRKYAVRSSANIEDNFETSFAGQFRSVLDVVGVENVRQAVYGVWNSTLTTEVKTYLEQRGLPTSGLLMGVLIQEMIEPVLSGVSFSRNPVTGSDEIIIEGVKGVGTNLVQSGFTPERWVNKWGYWLEKPDQSFMPAELVKNILTGTKKIAQKLRENIDLEWVWDGQSLYWVQVRRITTLKNRNVYSNYIPREMLPGMIKPLVFTINIPLINSVWINWISEITGDLGIKPEDLARSFYYRVYFNMGKLGDIFESLGLPRDSVEMMMGYLPSGSTHMSFKPSWKTLTRVPKTIVFILDKLMLGPRMHRSIIELKKDVSNTQFTGLEKWTEVQILEGIEKHYTMMQNVAYFNVLGPLMMGFYNRSLQSQLKKKGVEYSNFDLTDGMIEIHEYNPSTHLRKLNGLFKSFSPEIQELIRKSTFEDVIQNKVLGDFPQAFAQFADRFGYLSDNGNDFTSTPWREKLETLLKLVTDYEPEEESNHEKIKYLDLRLQNKTNAILQFHYRRAREFLLLREQVSALYTYGYGLFRYYFLALGYHFVNRNLIDTPEDIFYLTFDEVKKIIRENQLSEDLRIKICQHKTDMERYHDIVLPIIIYGDDIPPIREIDMEVMTGVASSIGHYTGPVQVVRGIDDFAKMKKGDVLVIPYSDVGWTPLFARAGAVVAESGGLLSHSSIVAREYNIPAVVSVEGATHLRDGTLVTVDGHKGEVYILKE